MSETSVGIRQLKARLSEYLRRVKAGETVLITEHGQPVAQIIPATEPVEARLLRMVEAGLIQWSGRKLEMRLPAAQTRGEQTVADLLIEDRE